MLPVSFLRSPVRLAGRAAIALLLAGLALLAQGTATRNATPAARRAPSGRPFPVTFTDIAAQAGLAMRFTVGNEETKRYIIEANGTGVAFVDYDNDHDPDIFVVNGSRLEGFPDGKAPTNHLYRNAGDGTFVDVTTAAGLARSGWGNGVCAGDVDNDGHTDLYVTYWGPNALYRNLGDGRFTDIAAQAGVAGPVKEWSSGCTFLDYDRDGRLDLFVTSYQQFDLASAPPPGKSSNCEWKGMPVFCGPRGLPYGSVTLYRNKGDGTFEDVSQQSGVREPQGYYAFTAVAADLNDDGWVDLYVACDSTPSLFFRNNRNGTFTELGAETGLAFNEHGFEQGGMGVAVGDYDQDGRLDLLKTNFAGDYPNVYHGSGQGIFEDHVTRAGLGVNPQVVGWGVGLVDLDNDGWEDVFQVNGHVYPELNARRKDESYRQPRLVYRNLGNGTFEDVSAQVGAAVMAKASSRGAAFGDFDNDGDLDVLVMNMGGPPSLLRNDNRIGHRWLKVLLRGTTSNRSAIGAVVAVRTAKGAQRRPVLGQSSFLSQNEARLHFGLGAESRVEGITVRWPSGVMEEFPGTATNRTLTLTEGSGTTKPLAGG